MITIPPTNTLVPEERMLSNGKTLYSFPGCGTELVKLDLLYEAGSAYQPQMLCAAAACKLALTAGGCYSADRLSEFMDYRGIVIEKNPDTLQCGFTVYFLRKYADELLPVLSEVLQEAHFGDDLFEVYCAKRRQELLTMRQKTSEMARRCFYQSLFGQQDILARCADVEDVDRLTLDVVKEYYCSRYGLDRVQVVAAGCVDDALVALIDKYFGQSANNTNVDAIASLAPSVELQPCHRSVSVPGSVQSTLRIGRVVPLEWNSPDYADMMILTTILGGYFGSRLMSNIREDKGYTYGIYSRTQIYRGCIVFYITTDVAKEAAEAAEGEIVKELEALCNAPVGDDELQLVRTVLAGDFIRSVDGVFERSARFCNMLATRIDERFTDNLRQALLNTNAVQLNELARRMLKPDSMTYCRAGV